MNVVKVGDGVVVNADRFVSAVIEPDNKTISILSTLTETTHASTSVVYGDRDGAYAALKQLFIDLGKIK